MAPTLVSTAELVDRVRQSNVDPHELLLDLVEQYSTILVGDAGHRQALAEIFGQIDRAGAPHLILLACEPERDESIRILARESLQQKIESSPNDREIVIQLLRVALRGELFEDERQLTHAVQAAIQLQAKELAYELQTLFEQDQVDTGVVGTWDQLRERMQIDDHNLIPYVYDEEDDDEEDDDAEEDDAENSSGDATSVFSEVPVFDEEGNLTKAYHEYIYRAMDEFEASPEWEQTSRNGIAIKTLLTFGAEYEGLLIDEMDVATIREYLLEHFPAEIIVAPEAAPAILVELQKFWEFVDRQYQLPNARPILDWLYDSRRVAELEPLLSDEPEFDIDESVLAEAAKLGYDLSTPEGLEQFAQALSRASRADHRPTEPAREPEEVPETAVTYVSTQPKVGRNEPCPCGSGKKFKKCCQRQGGQDN